MKIVCYANGPMVSTGFGSVVREIFGGMLARGFLTTDDVNFFAINYRGAPHDQPWRCWPAGVDTQDPFGRDKFAAMALGNAWPIDVLFLLEDHFTLSWNIPFPDGQWAPFIPGLIQRMRAQVQAGQRPPFKVVQYIPIDHDTVRPEWVRWIADCVDIPVAYTQFGKRVLLDTVPTLAGKLRQIPHGTTPEIFFPLPAEERARVRKQFFPDLTPEDWLLINVNRNQPRKDVPRTLQIFAEVLRVNPRATLYLHMNMHDSAGYNLQRMVQEMGIPAGRVRFPGGFSEAQGFPLPVVNQLLNAADVYLTTTRGGGWELCATEALTASVPVVAPDHTSHREILAADPNNPGGDADRGWLVPAHEHVVMINDNDQFRPIVDVQAMAAVVIDVLRNRQSEAVRGVVDRALTWARSLTWRDAIVPQWEAIFREASAAPAPATRALPRRLVWNAERVAA